MIRFIGRNILFLILLGICLTIGYFINQILFNSIDYRLPEETETLIIGDSRPNTGLNPNMLDNAINLSIRGEPTYLTHLKFKHFVEHSGIENTNVRNIICGFSFHNISLVNNELMTEESMANRFFEKYIYIVDDNYLEKWDFHKRAYRVQFFKQKALPSLEMINFTFFNNEVPPRYDKLIYFGRYRENYEVKIGKIPMKRQFRKLFRENMIRKDIAHICVEHLDSIVQLADELNCQLYVVHFPYHHKLYKAIPKYIKQEYANIVNRIDSLPHVTVLEYSGESLPDDHFLDYGHLNTRGASIYSKKIRAELQAHNHRNNQ